MKKFVIALLATAAAAGPIAATSAEAQQYRHDDRRGSYAHDRHDRQDYRRWSRGQRFDRRYARDYREIRDWRQYRGRRLYAPPRGYHWVRSGNDAVLVAVAGGLVGAVLAGAFD